MDILANAVRRALHGRLQPKARDARVLLGGQACNIAIPKLREDMATESEGEDQPAPNELQELQA